MLLLKSAPGLTDRSTEPWASRMLKRLSFSSYSAVSVPAVAVAVAVLGEDWLSSQRGGR